MVVSIQILTGSDFLHHNSPTFRKLFPEYVEKYNQQQLAEKLVAEQVSAEMSREENSTPMLERVPNSLGEDVQRIDAVKVGRKARKQSFPTWMMFLLVSIFGIVMALPLLQL
jgi:ubiquitin-conjugating enzyme E2 J2